MRYNNSINKTTHVKLSFASSFPSYSFYTTESFICDKKSHTDPIETKLVLNMNKSFIIQQCASHYTFLSDKL